MCKELNATVVCQVTAHGSGKPSAAAEQGVALRCSPAFLLFFFFSFLVRYTLIFQTQKAVCRTSWVACS